ncbi:MAG: arsenate reductase ArsC [Alphaproteobacteria bacterium]|nr:arsenate reductase ArsC [Alphaproteobacteria bacterium]
MRSRPFLVLFLSTGNAARSIMAESLLNARESDLYRARSAGITPLPALDPQTITLLRQAGYETEKLHAKGWQDFYAASAFVKIDVIVTLSEEARISCPEIWPHDPVRVHWAVDDPLGVTQSDIREWKFRKLLTTLDRRITTLLRHRPPSSAMEMLVMLKEVGMVV